MKHKIIAINLALQSGINGMLALVLASCIAGCTSYFPAKLDSARQDDTLSVALAGDGATRWDTRKDSLIIDCPGCATSHSVAVVHFEDRDYARFEIDRSQSLTLTLFSMGRDTVVIVPGEGTLAAGVSPELLPLPPREYNSRQMNESESENAKSRHQTESSTPEKTVKKSMMLSVTAPEGVAVYKDKTKREVLKILPQGSSIILLAREGDFYSVSVDGEEGFVEAEAVEIK